MFAKRPLRLGALTLIGLGLLATLFVSSPGASHAQPNRQKELDDLKKIVGVGAVTVYLQNNSNTVKGNLDNVTDFFGKRFLVLTDNTGRKTVVSVDAIAAIKQD